MTDTLQKADSFVLAKGKQPVELNGNTLRHFMAEFADQISAEKDAEIAKLNSITDYSGPNIVKIRDLEVEIARLRSALERILAPSPSMFKDKSIEHMRGIANEALKQTTEANNVS